MQKVNLILKEVLNNINPKKEEINEIEEYLKEFLKKFKFFLGKENINAQIFVGGSFAKKTLIKKGVYDIDVFIRFNEEYRGKKTSEIIEKILKDLAIKGFTKVHGSRDYFRIDATASFFIELIPVLKVNNPKKAENITDLSYFHVDYINKNFKGSKLVEEVRLAKAFCHANNCYGAESYINGFSGYALELLIYHYGSFLKFIKTISKMKEKEIIDIEKHYKNKNEVMMNLNSAKLASPIVLIDPTYKERNALAALNEETFNLFKKACINFLKKPSLGYFEKKETDFKILEKNSKKKGLDFLKIEIQTNKQKGDIAGSKLLKFYRYLTREIEKYFKIYIKEFIYDNNQKAELFFAVKNKGELILKGPNKEDNKNVEAFKRRHKKVYIKNKFYYASEKFNKTLGEFIKEWKSKNSQIINEMNIIEIV